MQFKNYLIGILAIAAIVVGLIFAMDAKKASNAKTVKPAYSSGILTALENDYDFGVVSIQDGNVSHKFTLKNGSKESIIIKKISTSCICATAYLRERSGVKTGPFGISEHSDASSKTDIEIEAGQTAELEVIFDPTAHGQQGIGKIKRVVSIETNAPANPKLQLRLEAEVVN